MKCNRFWHKSQVDQVYYVSHLLDVWEEPCGETVPVAKKRVGSFSLGTQRCVAVLNPMLKKIGYAKIQPIISSK